MTITFNGHVEALRNVSSGVEVAIQTPMDPTEGAQFLVRVSAKDAQYWLPGRVVSFTLYALPDANGPAEPTKRDWRLSEDEILDAFVEAFPGHDLHQESIDFARAVERRVEDRK